MLVPCVAWKVIPYHCPQHPQQVLWREDIKLVLVEVFWYFQKEVDLWEQNSLVCGMKDNSHFLRGCRDLFIYLFQNILNKVQISAQRLLKFKQGTNISTTAVLQNGPKSWALCSTSAKYSQRSDVNIRIEFAFAGSLNRAGYRDDMVAREQHDMFW